MPGGIYNSLKVKFPKAWGLSYESHLCPLSTLKEEIMSYLSEYAPIVIGLALGWFVILGTREILQEASSVFVKKSNA